MTKIETTINQLPALTWNWLRINRANLDESLPQRNDAAVSADGLTEGITFNREDSDSLSGIRTAFGENFDAVLNQENAAVFSLKAGKDIKTAKPVTISFDFKDDSASFLRQNISAGEGSEITVIMDFSSAKDSGGVNAVQTKVAAGKYSKVHLITVQLMGKNYVNLNDIGCTCAENALVDVTQIELGSKKMYTGVYASLEDYKAAFKSDLSYLCTGSQELDMNFVAVHTGKKTDCNMNVKGTIKDAARKTYRGTIDFKNGCCGSTGNEQEETLLLTPTVVNKSIPLILCDEEDVSGEHGATIGRLEENILFYMNSRGIEKKAAEKIMARAKVMSVAGLIGNNTYEEKISDFLDGVFDE